MKKDQKHGTRVRTLTFATTCFTFMASECAAENKVTIQDIVEFRDFSGIEACTESNLIAARVDRPTISQNRINHDWRIIEWPSGNVRITVDAGESLNTLGYRWPSYPQWSPDCHWLYYRALHDGEVQIWRLNGSTGAQEQVTAGGADILNFLLTPEGQALVYETSASRAAIVAAESREYQNGVLMDENIWSKARLTRTFPVYGRWAPVRRWKAGGSGHLLSREPPTYNTLILRNHKIQRATESEIAALNEVDSNWVTQPTLDAKVSASGEIAAVVLAKTETVYGSPILGALAIVRRKTPSEIHYCSDDNCMAERLVLLKWSEDESSIHFISEQKRGAAGVYRWTPATGEMRTIIETNGLLGALASGSLRVRSGPCPVIEDTAFCTAADPENPPRLTAISLASGSFETVFDPNADLRKRFALKAERITWKDNLDRDAVGILVYPKDFKNGTRYPLIITTYRCPGFLSGGVADGGPEYVLAEKGFLVLCIEHNFDVPPSIGNRYSYAEAQYRAARTEYESAVDMLARDGLADSHRVGVTGLSMSSHAISYVLTHSEVFHVAALRSIGVWEPAHEIFLRAGMAVADFLNKAYGFVGTEQDKQAVYEDLSVAVRAERVTAPILVQPSDSEYLGSLPAFAALQKLGKPIEMIVFPDETHQLHQPVHRYVNFTRNLDWFRFWLQGYEDPARQKEEQYARWGAMREEHCARLKDQDNAPWYCRH